MAEDNLHSGAPIKLAIAGIGLIGKRHADAVGKLRQVELCAIIDPSADGREYAATHGLPWFETIDGMLATVRPNGIVLATPTPLHFSQAMACIAHKLPVLVEKPLTVIANEALQLATAAQQADVLVLVGHHRRHNPIIQKAHQIIREGKIGQIRAAHVHCWFYKPDHYFDDAPWRKQRGAGPISVNLVHDVDLMRYLCGEIVSVQAQAAPSARGFENEDVAAAILTFANGAIGTMTVADSIVAPWSWEMTSGENPAYPRTAESAYHIGGTLGSLSIPDLTLWNHQSVQDWLTPISATSMPRPASDPLVDQMAHFVRVIIGKASPLVSAREGCLALQVIEAIQIAAATGQTQAISQIISDPTSAAYK